MKKFKVVMKEDDFYSLRKLVRDTYLRHKTAEAQQRQIYNEDRNNKEEKLKLNKAIELTSKYAHLLDILMYEVKKLETKETSEDEIQRKP